MVIASDKTVLMRPDRMVEIVTETLTSPDHLAALCHDLPGYVEGIDDPLDLARTTAYERIVDEWHQAHTEEVQRLTLLRDCIALVTIGTPMKDPSEEQVQDYERRANERASTRKSAVAR